MFFTIILFVIIFILLGVLRWMHLYSVFLDEKFEDYHTHAEGEILRLEKELRRANRARRTSTIRANRLQRRLEETEASLELVLEAPNPRQKELDEVYKILEMVLLSSVPDEAFFTRGRLSRREDGLIDLAFETSADAHEILTRLKTHIDSYGHVTVQDYYDLAGVASTFADYQVGWNNLNSAEVAMVREGYVLELPRTRNVADLLNELNENHPTTSKRI